MSYQPGTPERGCDWSDGTPGDRGRRDLHPGNIAPIPEGGFLRPGQLFRRGRQHGSGVDDRHHPASPSTRPSRSPIPALVGPRSPIIQAAPIPPIATGARRPHRCVDANFGPIGHRTLRGQRIPVPNDVKSPFRGQRQFPRSLAKPAFPDRSVQGPRRRGLANSPRGLETGENSTMPGPASRPDRSWPTWKSHQAIGPPMVHRPSHQRRTPASETRPTQTRRWRRSALDPSRAGPHPVPDRTSIVGQCPVDGRSTGNCWWSIGYGSGRAGHLQRAAGARGLCLDQQRRLHGAGHRRCPMRLLRRKPGSSIFTDRRRGVANNNGVPLRVPVPRPFDPNGPCVRDGPGRSSSNGGAEIGSRPSCATSDASGVSSGANPSEPGYVPEVLPPIIEMFLLPTTSHGVDPEAYMAKWLCNDNPGPDTSVAGRQYRAGFLFRRTTTRWSGRWRPRGGPKRNGRRSRSSSTTLLMQATRFIPLVHRGGVSAHANTLGAS